MKNENSNYFTAIIVFLMRKNELQNLCLCNSRDGCQLSSIRSTGRNLSFAKFCLIFATENTDLNVLSCSVMSNSVQSQGL